MLWSWTFVIIGPKTFTTVIWCNMQKAIELLHNNGYVFGDFHDSNVLVQEGGGVMLIDLGPKGKPLTPFG